MGVLTEMPTNDGTRRQTRGFRLWEATEFQTYSFKITCLTNKDRLCESANHNLIQLLDKPGCWRGRCYWKYVFFRVAREGGWQPDDVLPWYRRVKGCRDF